MSVIMILSTKPYNNEFYYDSSLKGTMYDLSDWIIISNKVISFKNL